jgi:cytochrome c biogenesis protein CcmG/thiol:disulfide interchange protein DsbE
MNRRILAAGLCVTVPLLGLMVAGLSRDTHAIRSPMIGRPAPGFSLTPLGGGPPVSLADLRGRPVVLNFWASWCGPCLQEHAALVQSARASAGRAWFFGVVYDDDQSSAQRFLRQQGSAYPSLVDEQGRTAIAYGVYGVPETFFIDAAGTVVTKHTGPLDQDALADELAKVGSALR